MQSTQPTQPPQPPQPAQPTIELLYFADCPTYMGALEVLQDALRHAGMSAATVHMVCVESDVDARRHAFYGSPTIRINGRDVVPMAPGAFPCLCCRFYRTPDGGWQSQPTLEAVLAALQSQSPEIHQT